MQEREIFHGSFGSHWLETVGRQGDGSGVQIVFFQVLFKVKDEVPSTLGRYRETVKPSLNWSL